MLPVLLELGVVSCESQSSRHCLGVEYNQNDHANVALMYGDIAKAFAS